MVPNVPDSASARNTTRALNGDQSGRASAWLSELRDALPIQRGIIADSLEDAIPEHLGMSRLHFFLVLAAFTGIVAMSVLAHVYAPYLSAHLFLDMFR